MSDGNELSKEELDALLSDASEESTEADEGSSTSLKGSDSQFFDPATQARIVRDRLHTLEVINERFARQFRMNLFNLLRRNADISVQSVRYQRYSEFAKEAPAMANINMVSMKPLRGTALITFPHSLVSVIVENLFGGDGRFVTRHEVREFTATEQRIINRVLNLAIDAYQESWRAVHPIEIRYIRSEMHSKFATITSSPSEIVVATSFHVEIGQLESDFTICMPYAMVEPLREKLSNLRADLGGSGNDKIWHNRIKEEVQQSQVELVANFVELNLRIPQVMSLKPGDVVPIDLPEKVVATVNNLPMLECEFGNTEHKRALKVQRILNNHRVPEAILQARTQSGFSPLKAKESDNE
ncbi:Flagellar motor switch protein FliM [Pseudidiomarina piscicola]|uniref:Flagellar motor switch protein FliM n=1 Tax=Pseudidiomarina piscicola TaxID=2614830 RepID=A0A6S6WNB8_9GAMM|nr:flagellar motor switch protein FliM [Pseudidiomarina piscicola]CAB0151047.1 Flagellar motor switch protein FliM [Pseudidiomarina piscicola]VZT40558.1 Flagellar motor switch protein FliM [Pseudomonas aeruginosa]